MAAAVDLVRDVDLLCLDAGNTVIFLDHERLAGLLREASSLFVEASTLIVAEGLAKRAAETPGDMVDVAWSHRDRAGAPGWGRMVGTIAHRAGLDLAKVPAFLDAAWASHTAKNLWCRVPAGLGASLDRLRATGAHVVIVSNSEGMLDGLFRELGIRDHFDAIVDSGLVGVEKPDPRIFGFALERFGAAATRAVHLGDMYATDIAGARAAGIRCALIDPYDHYPGVHLDVPRVGSVVEVADGIAHLRT